ncbi:hypothetical protein JKP88DRAFT_254083 [Tribonema minus]|uniref:Uncharacterized protein n=1 Tax=Tribonema minus TaxID=303371 RepID=A0A835Z683_9STRA|nr:hypothetical protein JKP88DRAFT_254083 [Tribonema minus]
MVFKDAQLLTLFPLHEHGFNHDGSMQPRIDAEYPEVDVGCSAERDAMVLGMGDGQLCWVDAAAGGAAHAWPARHGKVLAMTYSRARGCTVTLERSALEARGGGQVFLSSYFHNHCAHAAPTATKTFTLPLADDASCLATCAVTGRVAVGVEGAIFLWNAGPLKGGAGPFEHVLEISLRKALEACGCTSAVISNIALHESCVVVTCGGLLMALALSEAKPAAAAVRRAGARQHDKFNYVESGADLKFMLSNAICRAEAFKKLLLCYSAGPPPPPQQQQQCGAPVLLLAPPPRLRLGGPPRRKLQQQQQRRLRAPAELRDARADDGGSSGSAALARLLEAAPRGRVADAEDKAACYFEAATAKPDGHITGAPLSTCMTAMAEDFAEGDGGDDAGGGGGGNADDDDEQDAAARGSWVDPWLGGALLRIPITCNTALVAPARFGACRAVLVRRCDVGERVVSLCVLDDADDCGSSGSSGGGSGAAGSRFTVLVATNRAAYTYAIACGGAGADTAQEAVAVARYSFAGDALLSIAATRHHLFALTVAGLEAWTLMRAPAHTHQEMSVGGILPRAPARCLLGLDTALVVVPAHAATQHEDPAVFSTLPLAFAASQAARERAAPEADARAAAAAAAHAAAAAAAAAAGGPPDGGGTQRQRALYDDACSVWRDQFCGAASHGGITLHSPPVGLRLALEPPLSLFARTATAARAALGAMQARIH